MLPMLNDLWVSTRLANLTLSGKSHPIGTARTRLLGAMGGRGGERAWRDPGGLRLPAPTSGSGETELTFSALPR